MRITIEVDTGGAWCRDPATDEVDRGTIAANLHDVVREFASGAGAGTMADTNGNSGAIRWRMVDECVVDGREDEWSWRER